MEIVREIFTSMVGSGIAFVVIATVAMMIDGFKDRQKANKKK